MLLFVEVSKNDAGPVLSVDCRAGRDVPAPVEGQITGDLVLERDVGCHVHELGDTEGSVTLRFVVGCVFSCEMLSHERPYDSRIEINVGES